MQINGELAFPPQIADMLQVSNLNISPLLVSQTKYKVFLFLFI